MLQYLLGQFDGLGIVLDPFVGSGSTAVACSKMGIKFIGIELNQKYCEVAQRRLAQDYLF